VNEWSLVYEGLDPEREGLREALCTLGNGFFATRGAGEESSADGVHYPGTYIAGGYNRLTTEIAGRTIVNEDLVNLPNWLPLTFRPEDGDWFTLRAVDILDYRQELDMRRGVLSRRMSVRDSRGRETTLETRRIVHMREPHLAAIEFVITPRNWSGPIRVRSMLDGSVVNSGVARYRALSAKHLVVLERGACGDSGIHLLAETTQSRLRVAESACTRAYRGEEMVAVERTTILEEERVGQELAVEVREGERTTVEKIVALYTSRDAAVSEPSLEAEAALSRCGRFRELLESQETAWRHLWRRNDIRIEPPSDEQWILRLHAFHLLQTVCVNTVGLDVGVPARGLHGEAYRGHIFWDELFIFPFYNLRIPEVTRSLLLYRYRRLGAARRLARQAGYGGAMFPWQSGSDGREETQEIHLNPRSGTWGPDYSRNQRHVNAAIAYNVWQYYQVSGDRAFMERYGAETILEIARFFSSLSVLNAETERYEIRGVMGPDEYHESEPGSHEAGLRNNAYTNVMAVWVLERALEVLELLPARSRDDLVETLALRDDETERWHDILRKMTVCFHGDGIISQFEGYDALEELDWAGYRRRYGDIARLDRILKASGESPDRYKASKQPDVLMLFYLLPPKDLRRIFERLGYPLDDAAVTKTLRYYLDRTSHGSTLSKVVYASVMDRTNRARAWKLFLEALRSDVVDVQGGTTPEGIHLGAMAGTVDVVLRHYAGIDTTGPVIAFHPRLPPALTGLELSVRHRGRWFDVVIRGDRFRLEVEADGTEPVRVNVMGMSPELRPGGHYECALPKTT
jgi:trehalose/maltose hydrolase-like predicted phosphorylase